MGIQKILIDTNLTTDQFKSVCDLSPDRYVGLRNLSSFILSLIAVRSAVVSALVGGVQASASITFTGAPANDETITIANVVFTAKTSGAVGDQFNIGGNVTATALNLANAINANQNLSQILTATPNAGVITLLCKESGLIGNAIGLTEGLDNCTVVGFANGTQGTVTAL